MKRIVISILAVVLLIAAIGLVGPGLFGGRAETALRGMLADLSVPGVFKFEVTKYEKGWFSSTATSRFVLDGELAKSYDEAMAESGLPAGSFEVTFRHDIQHGPLIFVDGLPKIAAAQAETRISMGLLDLALAQFFKGEPLFTFDTSFGFGGGTHTHVESPSYDGTLPTGGSLRWDGIDGYFAFDGENLETRLDFPLLKFEEGDRVIVARDGYLEGNQDRYAPYVWLGKSAFVLSEIRAEGGTDPVFKLENLEYSAELLLDDEERIDLKYWLGLDNASVEDVKVGRTGYGIELNNIPPKALEDFYGAYFDTIGYLSDPDAAAAHVEKLVLEVLPALFEGPVEAVVRMEYDVNSQDAVVVGNTSLRIGGEDQTITAVLQQNIEHAKIEEVEIGESALKATLTGLNGRVLGEMYADLVSISMMDIPEWQQDEEIALMAEARLPEMLTPATRLTLDNVALSIPAGTATAQGELGFTGSAPLNLGDMEALEPRIRAVLEGRIDEAALVWLVARSKFEEMRWSLEGSGHAPTDTELEELATEAARGEISGYEALAFIARDGDAFTIDLKIEDGELTLNGVKRPDLLQ